MAARRSNVLAVAVGLALALWWWIRSRAAKAAEAAAAALRRDVGFPAIGPLGVAGVELASATPDGSWTATYEVQGDGPDGETGPVPNFTWAELKTVRPNAIAEPDKWARYVRLAYRLQTLRLALGNVPLAVTQVVDYPDRGYAVARVQVSGKYTDDKGRQPLQKALDFLDTTAKVKGKGPFSVAQPTSDAMSLWVGPFGTELP